MPDLALLEHTLELVAQRIGDPAPRVFERLFAESPELQGLFGNDPAGSVRGEMFHRALECLLDAAGPVQFVTGLVGSEHLTHQGYGVSTAQFERFFDTLVAVFQEALGDDWSPAINAAWARTVARVQGITSPQPLQPAVG
jgi:hemoglobin-like flavoprotein